MTGDEVPKESPNKSSNFNFLNDFLKNFIKLISYKKSKTSISQEIANIVTQSKLPEDEERHNIILNVAHLTDDHVSDIMTPRTDIIAETLEASIDDIKKIMIDHNRTRVPIYQDSLDNVKGFVHIKDILKQVSSGKVKKINKILKQVLFVPPSMKVIDLLAKMRSKKINIAIVVDEYGGTDGLVTLEDLFEEVFGEIEEAEIENIDDKMFEVNARIKIEDLEERLEINLLSQEIKDKDEFDTLAGYLVDRCNKIPKEGEVIISESGIKFHIKEAEPRFIKTVVVEL